MPDNQVPNQGAASPAESTPPRKWANKYNTPEDLEKGYQESARETQKILAEAKADRARADALEATLAGIRGPQTDPVSEARARYSNGEATPEDLDLIVRSQAQAEVQQTLRPMINAANAQAFIPVELRTDAMSLLAEDQTLAQRYHRMAAGNPEDAADYIATKVRNKHAEAGMHQEDAAAKAARATARQDASIVTGGNSTGAGNDNTSAKEREEKLKLLAKKTQHNRDEQTFAKELFSGIQVWEPGQPGFRTLD